MIYQSPGSAITNLFSRFLYLTNLRNTLESFSAIDKYKARIICLFLTSVLTHGYATATHHRLVSTAIPFSFCQASYSLERCRSGSAPRLPVLPDSHEDCCPMSTAEREAEIKWITSHTTAHSTPCSSLMTFQSYSWLGAVHSDRQQTSAFSCTTVLDINFVKSPTALWWQHYNPDIFSSSSSNSGAIPISSHMHRKWEQFAFAFHQKIGNSCNFWTGVGCLFDVTLCLWTETQLKARKLKFSRHYIFPVSMFLS